MPMTGDSFQRRVALLRESWAERRQLKDLAGAHDFESQFGLLSTLYRWAREAAEDIRAVYGKELSVALGPAPLPGAPQPGFAITIGGHSTATFALAERARAGGSHWSIAVTVGSGGSAVSAGPERRNGWWTRARLEEVLLSLLGAYERAISEGGRPGRRNSLRPGA